MDGLYRLKKILYGEEVGFWDNNGIPCPVGMNLRDLKIKAANRRSSVVLDRRAKVITIVPVMM